ncbi:hypothetical protein JXB41_08875 [Candidatus Woesearchaeota archaeon]|nr:hypothetical protein [Candidatus Woesearchaeota archaeon]
MFLIGDKRKRFVDLIRELVNDSLKLGNHIDQWAESEDFLLGVEEELLHLLLHFLQKKSLIFKESSQTRNANELYKLLKGLQQDMLLLEEEENLKDPLDRDHGVFFPISKIKNKLKILIESIRQSDEKIMRLIQEEFGISTGMKWEVKDGNFCVQYHPDVKTLDHPGATLAKKGKPYLLIYDNDFLVASVNGIYRHHSHYNCFIFQVQFSMEAFIRHQGYVRRAILLLFDKGRILYWVGSSEDSTISLSRAAKRMYEFFASHGKFQVEHDSGYNQYTISPKGAKKFFNTTRFI